MHPVVQARVEVRKADSSDAGWEHHRRGSIGMAGTPAQHLSKCLSELGHAAERALPSTVAKDGSSLFGELPGRLSCSSKSSAPGRSNPFLWGLEPSSESMYIATLAGGSILGSLASGTE